MSLAKLKDVYSDEAPTAAIPYGGNPEAASPARALQQRLGAVHTPATALGLDRWPVRDRVALIVTVSAALWLAILTAATQAVHAVA